MLVILHPYLFLNPLITRCSMATEEDFQSHLDQHPDDHQTRMVLADFLQENNDPRANGYRALGRLKKFPTLYHYKPEDGREGWTLADWTHEGNVSRQGQRFNEQALPKDWFSLVEEGTPNRGTPQTRAFWRYNIGRKNAEDAAAHAFSQLSPERQHELLGLNEPQIDTPQQMSRFTKRRKMYKRYA